MAESRLIRGLSRAKGILHRGLTHGTIKWVLEFLLTLGVLYCVFSGVLILLFRTDSYWMAVTSGSMTHEGEDWRAYFENWSVRSPFLANYGLSLAENTRTFDTSKFPIQGGFERGDLLIIQGVGSVSDIAVGDVLIIDREPYDISLTHRVLAVWEENGVVRFTVKGDYNPGLVDSSRTPWHDDRVVLPEQVAGKVAFVIPKLGNIALWFQGR
jgi:hypothetical protein